MFATIIIAHSEASLADGCQCLGLLLQLVALVIALFVGLIAAFPDEARKFFRPIKVGLVWESREPYLGIYENTAYLRLAVTNCVSRDAYNVHAFIESLEQECSQVGWKPAKWFVPICLKWAHTENAEHPVLTAGGTRFLNVAHSTWGHGLTKIELMTEVEHKGNSLEVGRYRMQFAVQGAGGIFYRGLWLLKIGNTKGEVELIQSAVITDQQSRW